MYKPDQRCNGNYDCPYGEDEKHCGRPLNPLSRFSGLGDMMSSDVFGAASPSGNGNPDTYNPAASQHILDLNAGNFDSALASHSRILVNFYAPWCPTCVDFMPDFGDGDAAAVLESASVGPTSLA
jgi:hypothetical protein